jgi:gp16 family phage-associated protein
MESGCANTAGGIGPGRRRSLRPDRARIRDVRASLYASGQTVQSWARDNGETPAQVYKVLNGDRACTSGEAHRIAVKLGIKDAAPAPAASDA